MGILYAVICVMLYVQDLIPIQHISGELNIKRWVHHTYEGSLFSFETFANGGQLQNIR